MRLSNPIKAKIGIILLMAVTSYNMVIFSLGSPIKRLKETGNIFSLIGQDDITVLENRYSKLRKSLPNYGVVGYIINKGEISEVNDNLHLHVLKYAVSPVLVADGINYEYVIGNFYIEDTPYQDITHKMEINGFKVVKKINDRLVIFRRISQ